jgi:PAS domain S-box-containing protein
LERRGERIFGYSEAEIIGQDLSCIFTSKDIQSGQPKRELQTAMALGQAYEEAHHVRQDGTIFWASGVVTALRDEAGNMRGFSKVVRDITERKQAEEALQKANDDLEVKVEYRTTELRNANKALQSEIIERQQSEASLRLSDERLRLALQLNQASTWDWDMVTNKFIWCPNHELLFGLTPDTFDGTHETILKCIHPKTAN